MRMCKVAITNYPTFKAIDEKYYALVNRELRHQSRRDIQQNIGLDLFQ